MQSNSPRCTQETGGVTCGLLDAVLLSGRGVPVHYFCAKYSTCQLIKSLLSIFRLRVPISRCFNLAVEDCVVEEDHSIDSSVSLLFRFIKHRSLVPPSPETLRNAGNQVARAHTRARVARVVRAAHTRQRQRSRQHCGPSAGVGRTGGWRAVSHSRARAT